MLIAQNLRKQEFLNPVPTFAVRVATTTNGTLATAFDNASSVDGVTLVTGDYILLKNQTTQSENGVYIVQASGAPVRHPSYDTHLELNDAYVSVTSGSRGANHNYYQNNVLTSLSSNQSWSTQANSQTFIVPENVKQLIVDAIGGGGGGGSGGGNDPGQGGGGGAGGTGAMPIQVIIDVDPGDVLTLVIGNGGLGGPGTTLASQPGQDGGSTTITGTGFSYSFPGGDGGLGGSSSVSVADTGGAIAVTSQYTGTIFYTGAGDGGNGQGTTAASYNGHDGVDTIFANGGTAGTGVSSQGGGGGGGGGSYGTGGTGGNCVSGDFGTSGTVGGLGAGGGGGGGAGNALGTTLGGYGGDGGPGFATLYWIE